MAPFLTMATAAAFASAVSAFAVAPQAGTFSYDPAVPNAINVISYNATAASLATPNAATPGSPLKINLANKLQSNGQVYAYVTGTDSDGKPFFLGTDGNPYYPTASGSTPTAIDNGAIGIKVAAQGSSNSVNLDTYISSGRVYFSDGPIVFGSVQDGNGNPAIVGPSFTNPSDQNAETNFGWIEFTWNTDEIYVNLSYVDFVGTVISQELKSDGGDCVVKGLPSDGVSKVCSGLADQEKADGQKWSESCVNDKNGNPLRVLAPLHVPEVPNQSDFLSGYYDDYVNAVWGNFTSKQLTVDAADGAKYTGQVQGDVFSFDSDVGTFAKPNNVDIFGCNSGPFANSGGARGRAVAVLCAAFNRATFFVGSNGADQPDGTAEDQFYTTSPSNHYARVVHANEIDGRGYAFAFDDVIPAGGVDSSGACQGANPTELTLTVGSVGA